MSASRPALVDECHRRLTFQERPATQSLVLVLLLWYGVEIGTLYLGWTVAQWQWMFTTASFPALSPGLVLATISHDPAGVAHLFGNVAFLWLFAGEREQHMGGFELVGFFATTALVSVTVNSAVTGDSTLGASGGALAFVSFYGAHPCSRIETRWRWTRASPGPWMWGRCVHTGRKRCCCSRLGLGYLNSCGTLVSCQLGRRPCSGTSSDWELVSGMRWGKGWFRRDRDITM